MKKLLIFAVLCSWSITAQQVAVTGNVTDAANGAPVPGVSVMVEGTTQGVATDFDGNYEISVQKGAVFAIFVCGVCYAKYQSSFRITECGFGGCPRRNWGSCRNGFGVKKGKEARGVCYAGIKKC